jgi:hypothetical protein
MLRFNQFYQQASPGAGGQNSLTIEPNAAASFNLAHANSRSIHKSLLHSSQ